MSAARLFRFQSGGTVRDEASYVERAADATLLDLLSRGVYCVVAGPRQIGKSSLRVRTERRLKERGIRCVHIDLTNIGPADIHRWFYTLIGQLFTGFSLGNDSEHIEYMRQLTRLSPVAQLEAFLRRDLLRRVTGKVVIFIDEIDSLASVPFGEDFFAAIRGLYNLRADEPACERLTFCLLGVAVPQDLMRDPQRTPFNIGETIHMEDFSVAEMEGFLPGLRRLSPEPRQLLERLWDWTAGHPYMVQRICEMLVTVRRESGALKPAAVDEVVEGLFLQPQEQAQDQNLSSAAQQFNKDNLSGRTVRMLELYRQLLEGGPIPADRDSPVQVGLRLTGMVARKYTNRGVFLGVRNVIFARVFSLQWVSAALSKLQFATRLQQWRKGNQHPSLVLRGAELAEFRAAIRGRELLLSEQEFLVASLDQENLEALEKVNVQKHEALSREALAHARRMRAIGFVTITLGCLALCGTAIIIFMYRNEFKLVADRERWKSRYADCAGQSERCTGEQKRLEVELHHESTDKRSAERRIQQIQDEMDGCQEQRDSCIKKTEAVSSRVERRREDLPVEPRRMDEQPVAIAVPANAALDACEKEREQERRLSKIQIDSYREREKKFEKDVYHFKSIYQECNTTLKHLAARDGCQAGLESCQARVESCVPQLNRLVGTNPFGQPPEDRYRP